MKAERIFSGNTGLVIFTGLVLASRIPFLFNGYGVEEDAWGLVLNAHQIADTGRYIYSRLPGHPVQELALALIPGAGPFVFNGLSALFSTLAALFFALLMKKLAFPYPLLAGLALALSPVFYISSTYTIDYVWAEAFMLGSFYYLLSKKPVLAGLFLGLAAGCRMTSVLMALPALLLLWEGPGRSAMRQSFRFLGVVILTGLLLYLPALYEYGASFISTYPQPYPPLPKVIYKGTIGVWGITGCVALMVGIVFPLLKSSKAGGSLIHSENPVKLRTAAWLMVLIYTILYLLLPEKSAFFIPVIPFIIVLFAIYIKGKTAFKVLAFGLILSPFFPDMNLTDPSRGADYSDLAAKFLVSGQEIYLDPLSGPVFADYSKRRNKAAFVEKVRLTADTLKQKTVILSGWWYNQILVENLGHPANDKLRWVFYLKPDEMMNYLSQGYRIYYLPEQVQVNDRRAGEVFTEQYAEPLIKP